MIVKTEIDKMNVDIAKMQVQMKRANQDSEKKNNKF